MKACRNPTCEHADGQWRVARLDDVREGFDIWCEIKSVGLGRLVVDDVGFRVVVGHGGVLFPSPCPLPLGEGYAL